MRFTKYLIACFCIVLVTACASPEERAAEHLAKAQVFFDAGDFVKAKLEAQNAVQVMPKNAPARLLLARIAEEDQQFRQAVGHLLVAVDSDPDFVEARVRLGNYYFLGKAAEQAAQQAEAAMALAPSDPSVRLLNARVKFLQGDKEGAGVEAARAREFGPDDPDVIMFQAGLKADAGNVEGAFAELEAGIAQLPADKTEALRVFRIQLLNQAGRTGEVEAELRSLAGDFPDREDYQIGLARLYVSEGKVDEAEQTLRDLVANQPDDADRKITLAQFLASQRSPELAAQALQEFIAESPEAYTLRLTLAALYMSQKRPDDARDVYRALAELDPKGEAGLDARNRLVNLALRNQEVEGARALVDGILEDVPDNEQALLYRAAFHYTEGKYEEAIADLRIALRKNDQSEQALLLLARSYVRSGEATLAQDAYRRLVAINPKHPEASQELAALLAGQGDTAEAEEVLRARLEVDPDDTRAASGLIQTLLAQQDLEGAETEARRLVELNQDNALAQLQMGRVMQAKGSPEEAIAAYKSTLQENPEATLALQGLVSVLVENDRSAEAVEYLQAYLADNPDQLTAKFLLGAVLARQGNQAGAEAAYEEIIAANPSAVRAYIALAGLYDEGSAEREAIYRRGMEANRGNAELGLLLGSLYERAGRWEDAIGVHEGLLRANENNLLAANNLAALLLDYRQDAESHARALEVAKRLEESDQPALLDTLGWAYYRNGDYLTAVRYLERAVAGAGVPVLRYHLGMAYAKANNLFGAKQELSKALEEAKQDFPGIDEARATLRELEQAS